MTISALTKLTTELAIPWTDEVKSAIRFLLELCCTEQKKRAINAPYPFNSFT